MSLGLVEETAAAVLALFPEVANMTAANSSESRDAAALQLGARTPEADPPPLPPLHDAAGGPNDQLEDGLTAMRRQIAELVLERTQLRRCVLEQSETVTSLRRLLGMQAAVNTTATLKYAPSPDKASSAVAAAAAGSTALALLLQPAVGGDEPRGALITPTKTPSKAEADVPSPTASGAKTRRRASSGAHIKPPIEAAVVTANWNMELLDLVELLQQTNQQQHAQHRADEEKLERALAAEQARTATVVADLHHCKARLADAVLQRTQLHRLEQAAARLAGPRRIREGGMMRLEAAERATMAVHDDLYYIQRCDGLAAPVRSCCMAFLCMADLDLLQQQSPEYVPFVVKTFLTVAQEAAGVWNGYCMTQHKVMTAYAFRSPSAAINFVADVHLALLRVTWPDAVVYIKSFREVTEGKEVVFCGPKIFSVVYHGTPIAEINPVYGNTEYCGKDTIAAVQLLTQQARPGEILCNASWYQEYMQEQYPVTVQMVLQQQAAQQQQAAATALLAGGATTTAAAAAAAGGGGGAHMPPLPPAVVRKIRGFDVEERPCVSFDGFASAGSQPPQPQQPPQQLGSSSALLPPAASGQNPPASLALSPHFASLVPVAQQLMHMQQQHQQAAATSSNWSLLPMALKKRRRTLLVDDGKANSDSAIATLALAVRMTNGRLHGHIPEKLRRWLSKQTKAKEISAMKKKHSSSLSAAAAASGAAGTAAAAGAVPSRGAAAPFVPPQTLVNYDNDGERAPAAAPPPLALDRSISPHNHASKRHLRGGAAGLAASTSAAFAPVPQTPQVASGASVAALLAASTSASGHSQPPPANTRQLQLSKMGQKASQAMERQLMLSEDSTAHGANRLPAVGSVVVAVCVDLINGRKLRRSQPVAAADATGGGGQQQPLQLQQPSSSASLLAESVLSPGQQAPTPAVPATAMAPALSTSSGFSYEESVGQLRQLVSIACQLHNGNIIVSSPDDVAVAVFPNPLQAFRFAAYMQVHAMTSVRCMTALPKKEILPDEPMVRCGIAVGTVGAALMVPASMVTRGNKYLKLAARICSTAQGGEILVSGETVRVFRSVTSQLISTEFAIVGRGMKLLPHAPSQATELFSLQPTALAFRHKLLLANTAPIPPIVLAGGSSSTLPSPVGAAGNTLSAGLAASPAASRTPTTQSLAPSAPAGPPPLSLVGPSGSISVGGPQAKGTAGGAGGAAATTSPNTAAAAAKGSGAASSTTIQLIQSLEGKEYTKLMTIFTSQERKSLREFGNVPVKTLQAAQLRLERLEMDLMRLHDTAGIPVIPPVASASAAAAPASLASTAYEETPPLYVLYCDVESSAKLLEACAEHFVRSQQHYCRLALDAFALHDGYVVKSTVYEAFVVVFRSARAAVEAAVEVQLQLLSSDWPIELSRCERALRIRDARNQAMVFNGLRVRMGIAGGKLQATMLPSKRVDFQGPPVAQAVRLGRSAPGGEIWVAPDVPEAVAAASALMGVPSLLERFQLVAVQDVGARQNELLAVGLFPPQTALRVGMKFLPDRRERIANQSDTNAWWRSAAPCNNKPPAVKYMGSKRKGAGGAAASAAAGGGAGGGGSGGAAASVGFPLLVGNVETLSQKLEAVLEHATALVQSPALGPAPHGPPQRRSSMSPESAGPPGSAATTSHARGASPSSAHHSEGGGKTPHHGGGGAAWNAALGAVAGPSYADLLAILRTATEALRSSVRASRGGGLQADAMELASMSVSAGINGSAALVSGAASAAQPPKTYDEAISFLDTWAGVASPSSPASGTGGSTGGVSLAVPAMSVTPPSSAGPSKPPLGKAQPTGRRPKN